MNNTCSHKWVVALVTAVIVVFWWVKIADSVSAPEGHDFTTIPAGAEYAPGEMLVRFAGKAGGIQRSTAEKNEILSFSGGAKVERNFRLVQGLSLVKLPTGLTVRDAVKTFNKADGILYAEPNYKIYLASTFPNDTRFNELWGMHNTGQTGGTADADIDAPEAWDIATDSDIIVAVLDTGIDYTHPDLAANMWVNPGEIPGNGLDDDGNGYIDDVYGWDFADDDEDPIDYYYHGTHCAGTVGAVGNNNRGVVGVCWNVKIMNLKIFPNYEDEGFIAGAILAIEYGVDKGSRVLSNSWGGGNKSDALEDAIEAADAKGVLFVAAAGNYPQLPWFDNDAIPVYPASYDLNNIVAVMATDHYDNMSSFSHYGATSVDLGAPGSDILSTFPTYMTPAMEYWGFSTDYETIGGTSMATPHVAGACALVWSVNPSLSHLEVKDVVRDEVDEIAALSGLCVTGGRLNIYKAALSVAGPQPFAHDDNVLTEVDTYVDITLKADDYDGLPDPPGALSYIITSLPEHGTLSAPGAGAISSVPYTLVGNGNEVRYTPNSGYKGLDSFAFKANDGGTPPEGGDSNKAMVWIIIPIFYEDFESGLGGFTIDNTFGDGGGLWHRTNLCESVSDGHTKPWSLYYGQDNGCDYDAGQTQGVVTSPEIDLAEISPPVELSFNYFLGTEEAYPDYDIATVEVSENGESFTTVATNSDSSLMDPTYGWVPKVVDLSAMAGSTIRVRFGFCTVDAVHNEYPGFYVDDVAFSAMDIPEFRVKNSLGENVARFGRKGNLILKGSLTENAGPSPTADDEFIVKNSGETVVAIINASNGNMYIKGWLYENQGTLEPQGDNNFVIKDSSGSIVAYIDESGDLYLKGKLYENSNP